MSFRETPNWTVDCDRCGRNADAESDFSGWTDKDTAQTMAVDSEWLDTGDGRHYCYDCVTWDDDTDELIPLPPIDKAAVS